MHVDEKKPSGISSNSSLGTSGPRLKLWQFYFDETFKFIKFQFCFYYVDKKKSIAYLGWFPKLDFSLLKNSG